MSSEGLSRRDVGKAGVSLLALFALNDLSEKVTNAPSFSTQEVTPQARIGNLEVFFHGVEHWYEAWEESKKNLFTTVDRFPLIIPEYFPPEYKGKLTTGWAHYLFKSSNYLFDQLHPYLLAQKKNVCVVDPAYSVSAIALRMGLLSPIYALAGVNSDGILGVKRHLLEEKKVYGRRSLLQRAAVVAGATLAAGTASSYIELGVGGENSSGYVLELENDMRRCVIAEQLTQIGQVTPRTQALLIYPPDHVKGIQYYLGNGDERKKRVKGYQNFFSRIPGGNDFFRARHYKPNGSKWDLTSYYSLGNTN